MVVTHEYGPVSIEWKRNKQNAVIISANEKKKEILSNYIRPRYYGHIERFYG